MLRLLRSLSVAFEIFFVSFWTCPIVAKRFAVSLDKAIKPEAEKAGNLISQKRFVPENASLEKLHMEPNLSTVQDSIREKSSMVEMYPGNSSQEVLGERRNGTSRTSVQQTLTHTSYLQTQEDGGGGRVPGICSKIGLLISAFFFAFCSWCINIFGRDSCLGKALQSVGIGVQYIGKLTVVVHNAVTVDKAAMGGVVRLSCGRSSVQLEGETGDREEIVDLEIPKNEKHLSIEWVKRSKGTCLAITKLKIEDILGFAETGERRTVALHAKNIAVDPIVSVTFEMEFYKENESESEADSRHRLTKDPPDKSHKKKSVKSDRHSLSERPHAKKSHHAQPSERNHHEELTMLALGVRGPVVKQQAMGKETNLYLAVYQGAGRDAIPKTMHPDPKDAWKFWYIGWWNSKSSFENSEKPDQCIDVLRVSTVHAIPEKDSDFCVRWLDVNKEKQQMFLSKVDRSRDVWVESLHLFITELRVARKYAKTGTHSAEDSGSV